MAHRRPMVVLAIAVVLLRAVKLAFYPSYPGFDDAFIHLRIAENIALGKAWGVNATSTAVAIAYITTRGWVSSPVSALIPPVLFATSVHLWRWNATVMEPTLACSMAGLAIVSFQRAAGSPARLAGFGAITGIAFLARFELGLLLPAAAAVGNLATARSIVLVVQSAARYLLPALYALSLVSGRDTSWLNVYQRVGRGGHDR